MKQDNKNLFLALGLSMLVLIGWNYFYGVPKVDKARQTQAQLQNVKPAGQSASPESGTAAPPSMPAPSATPTEEIPKSRDQALAASLRVSVDTPNLKGSIALKGGRIDDVALKRYHETIDPKSPIITVFSPSGGPAPYFAESGYETKDPTLTLPGPDTLWTADSSVLTPAQPVTLTFDNGHGLIFKRTIAVDDQYMFTVKDSVDNNTSSAATLSPYALVVRQGKPPVAGYAVLHEGLLGVVGDSYKELTYDKTEKEPGGATLLQGVGGWVGFTDKYWASAVIPNQQMPFTGWFRVYNPKTYETRVQSEPVTVSPASHSEITTHVFAGAKEFYTIKNYETDLGIKKFYLMIDWGWFWFITIPLFQLIDFIYKYTGNFGIAILVVTVLVKTVFFPLANRSYQSMAKMKAVQPQMTALRERFANDKQKQQQELMELYKREKINPVAGCLPMVIQIPVFFALYKVIFVTIEMRHAPFFGWIRDLSAPDPTNLFNLFGLLPFDPSQLPVFGHFLVLGVWPIIMGFSMFVQMKMNPEPTDPVQKQMFAWMPVIFTFMLGSFPAGLVIYWTWNNTLSVIQQTFIMKSAGVKVELWNNLSGIFRKKPST
jgi:YidC/Oxa1 family membrane protein insertase